jgi:hypothetical protein
MWQWLRSEGRQYRNPKPGGGPNYLAGSNNKPFRHNDTFRSQPVLSEEARNKIWSAVMEQGLPLKAVSAKYSVDMRRVAAVVRMKEIERSMQASVSWIRLFLSCVLLFHSAHQPLPHDDIQKKFD